MNQYLWFTVYDCSHLHGASFIDRFPRVDSSKKKAIGAAIGAVGGGVSGMKKS